MSVCYLVRTHRNPAQIQRLITRLLQGSRDGFIVIMHDRDGCVLDLEPSLLRGGRLEVLRTNEGVYRGEFSMFAAYLQAIRWLEGSGRSYEWLVHLSGQDYPLRSILEIERDLEAAPYDAFVDCWRVGGPDDRWRRHQGPMRYHYHYRRFPDWMRPVLRALKWTHSIQRSFRVFLTYGAHFGRRCRSLPFGEQLPLMGCSDWHNLRRKCVQYVLAWMGEHPEVLEHYRLCISPEESFIATVLCNAPHLRICRDNRRYIDWRDPIDAHPRTLTMEDLGALTSGRHDFARKFDIDVDANVLDALDRRIAPDESPIVAVPGLPETAAAR
jgi:hypothetical protein